MVCVSHLSSKFGWSMVYILMQSRCSQVNKWQEQTSPMYLLERTKKVWFTIQIWQKSGFIKSVTWYISSTLYLVWKYSQIFCQQTLSVPRSEQFPRVKLEELWSLRNRQWPRTNFWPFFAAKGDYCVYYPSNIFCNTHSFENWGISLRYSPVLAGAYLVMRHVGAEKFDKARYQDSRQGLSPASGW